MPRALRNSTIVLLTLTVASVVLGWGAKGHRITGDIAWQRLKPGTKDKVKAILGSQKLSYSCTWADEVRGDDEYTWLDKLHFVNLHYGETAFDDSLHCSGGECATGAIRKCAAILRDPNVSDEVRKEALKLLGHCVGDLHQPLHVSYAEDRGGNLIKVKFFGQKKVGSSDITLHKVWDNLIIDRRMQDLGISNWDEYSEYLLDHLNQAEAAAWSEKKDTNTLDAWAQESFELARVWAYREINEDGTPNSNGKVKSGDNLAEDYYDDAWPIIEKQLQKGAVRLAAILDAVFSAAPLPYGLGDPTAQELRFIGAPSSKVFHFSHCDWAKKIKNPTSFKWPPADRALHEKCPTHTTVVVAGATTTSPADQPTVRIAFWNIRDLSVNSRDANERQQICDVIRSGKFDALGICEVNDTQIVGELEHILDAPGDDWKSITSSKVGNSPSSAEHYAVLYRAAVFSELWREELQERRIDELNIDASDLNLPDDFRFDREPFAVALRTKNNRFDFAYVIVHVTWGSHVDPRIAEIRALSAYYNDVLPREKDVLVCGDFNRNVNDQRSLCPASLGTGVFRHLG